MLRHFIGLGILAGIVVTSIHGTWPDVTPSAVSPEEGWQTFYITSTGNPARDVHVDGPFIHTETQRDAEDERRTREAYQKYGVSHVRAEVMPLGVCAFVWTNPARAQYKVTSRQDRAEYNDFVRNVAPTITGYELKAGPSC